MAPSVSPHPRRGETASLPAVKRSTRFCDGPKKQVQSLLSVILCYDERQLCDDLNKRSNVELFLLCFYVILWATIKRTDFKIRTNKVFSL